MRQIRDKSAKRKARRKNLIITASVLLIIVLAIIGGGVYTASEASSDKILRNVYVDGIRIGGMKTAEAAEILEDEFSSRKITVVLDENESREFTLDELGLSYKTDVIVGEAYGLGKDASFSRNVAVVFSSFFKPTRLSSSKALIHTEPSEEFLEYLRSYGLLPTESNFEILGDKVVVTNGMNGREVDEDKLIETIENADSFEEIQVLQAPVNILPFVLPDVDDIYKSVASQPCAPYGRNDNGEITATVKVFNLDVARKVQEENAFEGCQYEFVIDEETVIVPDTDALYPDVVGEKTTQFDTGYTTRAHNIRLAAGLLDGAQILPDEEFSFNGRIGEITAEKGYQVAKGYANGTVIDSVGAGVCQISSTLYNAVLNANLEVTKRSNHSLPVSYLPLGQDAAINYPTQDFKFKNNTDCPLMICASVEGGSLTVQIKGVKTDDFTEVKIINNTLSIIEPKVKEVVDDSLSPGKRVIKQKGSNGYVVESFRVVYKDGVEIKRENLGKSTYKAQDKIINVGKEETEETADGTNSQLLR